MESNPNRWRSPRYQGQGGGPPWQSPQNRFRGGGGGDRFYSPRMSPRTPQNFSPYNNNYNRNSPQFYNNSQRPPYQPRYSPNYRHRQNFYQSSPGFHDQSSYSSPKSFGRQQRGSNNWGRDDIENWILPSMWEDPWADLRRTTCPSEKSYLDATEASNDNTEDTTRPPEEDEAPTNDTDVLEKQTA